MGSTQRNRAFVIWDSRLRVTEVAVSTRQNSLSDKHQGHSVEGNVWTRAVLTPERKNIRQQGRRTKHQEEMFTLTARDQHGVCL